MATVNLGNIKLNWKGAYNSSTAYIVDDVVSYNGSSYVCILASTGNLPTVTTYWNQMSAAGTDGTDVGTTITTQGDILYRDGSGLARLAAGTSGQFLKTQGSGANPVWGTVTTKLLGYKINAYQGRVDKGNLNQTASVITQLNTTYGSPVSTNSFFVVRVSLHGTQYTNHGRAFFEYSVDGGSNWGYSWSNGSDAGITRSGEGMNWSTDDKYEYPQLAFCYDNGDANTIAHTTATSVYQPSRPHSVSDFRVRVQGFTTSSTDSWILNGTKNNSASYGQVCQSSVEIFEYSA